MSKPVKVRHLDGSHTPPVNETPVNETPVNETPVNDVTEYTITLNLPYEDPQTEDEFITNYTVATTTCLRQIQDSAREVIELKKCGGNYHNAIANIYNYMELIKYYNNLL